MPAPFCASPLSLSPTLPCSHLLTLYLEITPLSQLGSSHLQVDLFLFFPYAKRKTGKFHPGSTSCCNTCPLHCPSSPCWALGFNVVLTLEVIGCDCQAEPAPGCPCTPPPVLFVSINSSGRAPQPRALLPPILCDIPGLHWAEWCPQQA